jgi:soluble lytic murein transglycosylase-like protein
VRLVAPLLALLLALPAAAGEPAGEIPAVHPAENETGRQAAVERYLEHFFRRTDGKRLAKAKAHIPDVVAAAEGAGLDPLLVAVVIAYESTWSPKAMGKDGEVGLMQVHGLAAEGHDVSTIPGNLAAGCSWLRSRIDRTGSLEAGVAAYIGDSERARRMGRFRVERYREELKRQGLREP